MCLCVLLALCRSGQVISGWCLRKEGRHGKVILLKSAFSFFHSFFHHSLILWALFVQISKEQSGPECSSICKYHDLI